MSATARIREPYQTAWLGTIEQHFPMGVWSKAKVSLGDRSRINYESSVDIKNPVKVDEKANPEWKPGQLCWEATGKCAQDFKHIESELREELNQSRQESFAEISICLVMIGKTPLKAKPVIIISSEYETSREEARKVIIKTKILETSYFEIGYLKYLPSGPIHPVAGSHVESSWDAASADPSRSESHLGESNDSSVYYNPELRLRTTGMPIYVKVLAGQSRMATANVVYKGSTYGYLTAAHVLNPWDRSSSSIDNGDEDLGVPFDSDSEDEDYCNEPMSLDENSTPRSETSTESSISSNENSTPLELTTPTASSGPIELESPCPSNLTLLGQLAPGKSLDKSLDYAIITVENTELHQQREHLSFSKARQTAHVLPTRSESSLAAAYTTHGLVLGKVTDVPILMRLPGSRLFQPVFTFTYEGTIKNGDCGSLVLDTTSKELCGMIIAASERQCIAYMVGAKELLNDIENAGWHLLSLDEDYMDSTEHQDEGTNGHPQTTRSPRAMSPPKTTSQLVSSQTPSQPEWNAQFQRYLYTIWDAQYGRYYWKHHVEGQGWVFFDWIPISAMTSSHTRSDYLQTVTSSASGPLGYGRGKTIQGSYSPQNPAPSSHYELLDPSFFVRSSSFFEEGRVFSVLFTETAGADNVNGLNPMADYNTNLSRVKYNEYANTQVRRFIVVRRKREFCFAVPIFSYGNKGTTKRGVVAAEHAIAYSLGTQPQLVLGEAPLAKAPIPIVMDDNAGILVPASRIYFAIHHPIKYDVKVKSLGYVHPDYLPTFLGYWNQENWDSQQDVEVTQDSRNTDS